MNRCVLVAAALGLASACGDDDVTERETGDAGLGLESTGEAQITSDGPDTRTPYRDESSTRTSSESGASSATSAADETSSPATDSSSSSPSSTSASTSPTSLEASGPDTSGETSVWLDDSTSFRSTHDSSEGGVTSDPSTGYGTSGDSGSSTFDDCASGCAIDGECVAEGTPNVNNGCEVCRGSEDDTGWSPFCSSLQLCQEVDGTPTCGCPVGFTGETCDRCLIYVDEAHGNDEADGRSWGNALSSLNVALTAANSGDCEVWVAQGTYVPTTNSSEPRDATFSVPAGVDLYGGFAGDEWLREQRNVALNETILSGDLEENDDSELVASFNDNAYHVVSVISEGARRLDGFTIAAGHADYFGGGLLLDSTEAHVSQCVFRGNLGSRGAAVASNFSTATFEGCWFESNIADLLGGGFFISGGDALISESTFLLNEAYQSGGGISAISGAALHVIDSAFDDNEATYGGGALSLSGAAGVVTGCTFTNNEADTVGGAIDAYGATATLSVADSRFERNQAQVSGALNIVSVPSPVIVRSEFTDNYAASGSAALGLDAVTLATISNCGFRDNTTESSGGAMLFTSNTEADVHNSVFLGNQAAGYGGAIQAAGAALNVSSCSFSNNAAGYPGGAIAVLSGSLSVRNSVSWDNTAPQDPEVHASNASVSYSDIEGWCIPNENCDDGNINADPLFTSSTDLRLQSMSPAIDAGSNALLPLDTLDLDADEDVAEVLPLDYGLASRVSGAAVDMGAYEAAAP